MEQSMQMSHVEGSALRGLTRGRSISTMSALNASSDPVSQIGTGKVASRMNDESTHTQQLLHACSRTQLIRRFEVPSYD